MRILTAERTEHLATLMLRLFPITRYVGFRLLLVAMLGLDPNRPGAAQLLEAQIGELFFLLYILIVAVCGVLLIVSRWTWHWFVMLASPYLLYLTYVGVFTFEFGLAYMGLVTYIADTFAMFYYGLAHGLWKRRPLIVNSPMTYIGSNMSPAEQRRAVLHHRLIIQQAAALERYNLMLDDGGSYYQPEDEDQRYRRKRTQELDRVEFS